MKMHLIISILLISFVSTPLFAENLPEEKPKGVCVRVIQQMQKEQVKPLAKGHQQLPAKENKIYSCG